MYIREPYKSNQNRCFPKQRTYNIRVFQVPWTDFSTVLIFWYKDRWYIHRYWWKMCLVDVHYTLWEWPLSCFTGKLSIPHLNTYRIHIWTYLATVNWRWIVVRKWRRPCWRWSRKRSGRSNRFLKRSSIYFKYPSLLVYLLSLKR